MSNKSKFMPGNPEQCKSCIFRSPTQGGLRLQPGRMAEIVNYLCNGSQHTCHSNSNYACRGGRDIQLRILYLKGLIDSPTDEALETENQSYSEARDEKLE